MPKPCGHPCDETFAGCLPCGLAGRHRHYREGWCGPDPRSAPRPCRHLGDETRRVLCPSCKGKVELKVFACAVHGECTQGRRAEGVRGCCTTGGERCPDYSPWPGVEILPIDAGRLRPGRNFNCSLAVHDGRRVLAYRQEWARARVRFALLGGDWQPERNVAPDLPDSVAPRRYWGHEDPRLFHFRGRLHCSYTLYDGKKTDVGYCRLKDDFHPDAGWALDIHGRRPWEKNWGFFEWENDLYAVYTATPHVVLRIDGGRAERMYHTDWSPEWRWGEMRGGAPPVRVGDEYWSFFHSSANGNYHVGLYAFEARPPFRATRYCPAPLASADPAEKPDPTAPLSVVYPGGAVLEGGKWRVAAGYQDTGCRIYQFDAAMLEKGLRPC